jgi:hypothetical protein
MLMVMCECSETKGAHSKVSEIPSSFRSQASESQFFHTFRGATRGHYLRYLPPLTSIVIPVI